MAYAQDRGTSLASNQVQYSLLYRAPETNGVKQACEEGGTTLIAYSPLAQGLLTGQTLQHAFVCEAYSEHMSADGNYPCHTLSCDDSVVG